MTYNLLTEGELSNDLFQSVGEINLNTPERKLLAAILDRAYLDLSSEDKSLRNSAIEWFRTPYNIQCEYGELSHICIELDIDFGSVRADAERQYWTKKTSKRKSLRSSV